jgi:hypothetical protein
MNVDKCQIEFERIQTQRATGGKQENMVYCQYENDIISLQLYQQSKIQVAPERVESCLRGTEKTGAGKVSGGRDTKSMGSSKVRNKAVALAFPNKNTVRPLSPPIKQLYESSIRRFI